MRIRLRTGLCLVLLGATLMCNGCLTMSRCQIRKANRIATREYVPTAYKAAYINQDAFLLQYEAREQRAGSVPRRFTAIFNFGSAEEDRDGAVVVTRGHLEAPDDEGWQPVELAFVDIRSDGTFKESNQCSQMLPLMPTTVDGPMMMVNSLGPNPDGRTVSSTVPVDYNTREFILLRPETEDRAAGYLMLQTPIYEKRSTFAYAPLVLILPVTATLDVVTAPLQMAVGYAWSRAWDWDRARIQETGTDDDR